MKVAILIDGGNLRVLARMAGYRHDPSYIEKVAHACVEPEERILRVLYYDCAPYNGTTRLPVSGAQREFAGSDRWLHELAQRDLIAVRLGVLKFRGYRPLNVPVSPTNLTDADFEPVFEQKGVDMRIGLDIAHYCANKAVERIVLLTQHTDCVPAMKHARKSGAQVVLIKLPNARFAPELVEHADIVRGVDWPAP